jgi:hypothetical protein
VTAIGAVCATESAEEIRTVAPVKEESRVVTQSMGYFSLGTGPLPLPLPVFGVGYRTQSGYVGAEVSAQYTTLVYINQLKADLLLHYYPKPCLASQFYVGAGVGSSVIFGSEFRKIPVTLSPELVLGQQFCNSSDDVRFIQAQISVPTLCLRGDHFGLVKYPLVTISYGFGF